MSTEHDQVIAYLERSGLYTHLAAAAGVQKASPAVGDVHVPAAGDKPKPAVSQAAEDEAKPLTVDAQKMADISKRATAAGDVVFEKGMANLYVKRPLLPESARRLHDWAKEQGIKNLVPPELLHVTQVHSVAEVDTDKLQPQLTTLTIPAEGRWLNTLGKDAKALVMTFQSTELAQRFKEAAAAGASWDFPSFIPHVTLSYDAELGTPDTGPIWMMDPPDMPLMLGPEEFQASNDNWVAENKLAKGAFEMKVQISKVSKAQQIVGGWASIATIGGQLIVDKQGDKIPPDELEKAFHDFVAESRQHGEMHRFVGTGELIACLTFTKEKEGMGLYARNEAGEALEGTWVEFHVTDADTWKRIAAGELPEFSIGGKASPEEG